MKPLCLRGGCWFYCTYLVSVGRVWKGFLTLFINVLSSSSAFRWSGSPWDLVTSTESVKQGWTREQLSSLTPLLFEKNSEVHTARGEGSSTVDLCVLRMKEANSSDLFVWWVLDQRPCVLGHIAATLCTVFLLFQWPSWCWKRFINMYAQ